MELSMGHMAWLGMCRVLDLDDYTYTDDVATVFVPVVNMDTVLDLGEDLDETSDEIRYGLKECIERECGLRTAAMFRVDSRSSGNNVGAAISVNPSEFSEEDFGDACRSLGEAILSFMS